jgi:excisionase family DNA binding protein
MPRIRTEDYIRPTTAAGLLGVKRARVDQLIRAGLLPSVEIDGHRYLLRSAVEARAKAQRGGKA